MSCRRVPWRRTWWVRNTDSVFNIIDLTVLKTIDAVDAVESMLIDTVALIVLTEQLLGTIEQFSAEDSWIKILK